MEQGIGPSKRTVICEGPLFRLNVSFPERMWAANDVLLLHQFGEQSSEGRTNPNLRRKRRDHVKVVAQASMLAVDAHVVGVLACSLQGTHEFLCVHTCV